MEDRTPKSSRQEPSSCQSCRTKKLRCNRVEPCSNCTVRGIPCVFLVPPHKQDSSSISNDQPNSELMQRIQKLEAIINQSNTSRKRPAPDSSPTETAGSTIAGTGIDAVVEQRQLRHGQRAPQSTISICRPHLDPLVPQVRRRSRICYSRLDCSFNAHADEVLHSDERPSNCCVPQ
jgi:hypothetical protein